MIAPVVRIKTLIREKVIKLFVMTYQNLFTISNFFEERKCFKQEISFERCNQAKILHHHCVENFPFDKKKRVEKCSLSHTAFFGTKRVCALCVCVWVSMRALRLCAQFIVVALTAREKKNRRFFLFSFESKWKKDELFNFRSRVMRLCVNVRL